MEVKESKGIEYSSAINPFLFYLLFFPTQKLIQEAFTSKKRLIKEYEQLSIWYGDIDTDTRFHSEQCLSPHMTSASRPSQARDLGESEWELL